MAAGVAETIRERGNGRGRLIVAAPAFVIDTARPAPGRGPALQAHGDLGAAARGGHQVEVALSDRAERMVATSIASRNSASAVSNSRR